MSGSRGPRMKTVIRPGWVVPGSYREEDLDSVVDLVPLAPAVAREEAIKAVRQLVDSFGTWRQNSFHARSKADDLEALDLLVQSGGDLERLRALDPVLAQRLRLAARPGALRRGREDPAEILGAATDLRSQILTEEAKGRRRDLAGWMFAHRIYESYGWNSPAGTSGSTRAPLGKTAMRRTAADHSSDSWRRPGGWLNRTSTAGASPDWCTNSVGTGGSPRNR